MMSKPLKIISVSVVFAMVLSVAAFFLLPLPGDVPVLFYHFVGEPNEPSKLFVGKKQFDRQLAFLKTFGYRVLSLDELYDIKTGRMRPPFRAVAITFDDCSNWFFYCTALPIIEKHEIPIANFMVYDCALKGSQDSMSFKQGRDAIRRGVMIGSHSLTHPNFSEASEEVLRREIFESKKLLEKELGASVDYFSYPFGVYTPESAEFVREAGYKIAFITGRMRSESTGLFAIPRVKISHSSDNLAAFWLRVSGICGAFYRARDWVRKKWNYLFDTIIKA